MAGLTTVQYSGEPGSDAANIFVRGQATWNQSAPLIQVDGVERSMNDIDPNEIDRCMAVKGDLLVCEGGDIGRSCIWNYDFPIMLQNHIHKLRPYIPLCTKFVSIRRNAPFTL